MIAQRLGYKGDIIIKDSLSDAVKYAQNISMSEDLIVITGSLYLVGEARTILGLRYNA
ncbi:MAG: hypothetical protein M3P33_03855 [bacterium]|nr:hypothetical protein [bacterium]